jgi:uncharacterized protein (DUF2062 family)
MNYIQRKVREFLNTAKTLEGEPHAVALGMAIGIFVSLTPTVPFHMALSIFFAMILKASKAAAVLGTWLSNPLTMPFFYWGSYKVGAGLLGRPFIFDPEQQSLLKLLSEGLDITTAMLVGGVVMGIPTAVASYFTTRKLLDRFQSRRRKRS